MMSKSLNFSGYPKTPIIMQTEAAECGLACLAMVLSYHGHITDLLTLRQRFSFSSKGATLAHIMGLASQLNMAPRPVKLTLEHLDKLKLPVILHWDFNHFVVLTKLTGKSAVIHDPGRGRRVLSMAQVSDHFTGVALELSPDVDFKSQVHRKKIKISQLLGNIPGIKKALIQIILLAVVLELIIIAVPFYTQLVVDSILVVEDYEFLTLISLGFLLLVIMQTAVTALRAWGMMVLSTTLNIQLVANLFRHLLRLPGSYFSKRHLGDLVSRFESLGEIQRTLTMTSIEALLDGLMAVTTLAMMYLYSPQLANLVLLIAVSYALIHWLLYRPLRQASEQQIHYAAKQQSNFLETVRGIQSVKLFNRQDQRLTLYQNHMVDTFNASIRVQKLQMLFQAANSLLFGIENILVIWVAATLILQGDFSIGMLFAFIAYKQQFTRRTIGFIDHAIEFKMLELHLDRVSDIALTEPEKTLGTVHTLQVPDYSVEVTDLNYSYSDIEEPVLSNVNLQIRQGESVAIVGPSGCGKTTLLKLLLGLQSPTRGHVKVGGTDLRQIPTVQYRDLIGVVMQDDQLLAGSIAENISFFDSEADFNWIEQCALMAAIHDEIIAMPMGYNTLIGDMGTTLSGGQKQRILLARALYKRPKILFLDEATSNLDITSERKVNETVRGLAITRIFIAHRPETIALADRVIHL